MKALCVIFLFSAVGAFVHTPTTPTLTVQKAATLPAPLRRRTADQSRVVPIQNEDDFNKAMKLAESELVVIKYFASWCKACKTIEPKFKRLSAEFKEATFYEVEFGANKDLVKNLQIKKLPCAQLYRNGLVDTVVCGPSKFPNVRNEIEKFLGLDHVADDVPEFTDISDHYE